MILSPDELDELNIVHHGVLHSKVSVISLVESIFLLEWEALPEVSVLAVDDKGTEFLGQGGGDEACVFVETLDVPLVSGVKEDWSLLARGLVSIVLGVHKILHLESTRILATVCCMI